MVTLVKKSISDMVREYIISDGTFIDYFHGKMDNVDIFRMVGKAYSQGYSDFAAEVHMHGKYIKVVESRNGNLWVNWDIVRIADLSEWYGRTA